jgi:hypothetical protein
MVFGNPIEASNGESAEAEERGAETREPGMRTSSSETVPLDPCGEQEAFWVRTFGNFLDSMS